jgi:hypothetical protein
MTMEHAAPAAGLPSRTDVLREDLGAEYHAIAGVVSDDDGRLAVPAGAGLFVAAVLDAPGLERMHR